jgi:hypothetical protein
VSPCPSCREGLDHCHGTLLVHAGAIECTDPACAGPVRERHELLVGPLGTDDDPREGGGPASRPT